MTDKYILSGPIGHTPEPCSDLLQWAKWFEATDRRVALTENGDIRVSTVFRGIDHQFDNGPPLLFETLISGGPLDGEIERYSIWEQAAEGHMAMCKKAFS